MISVRRPPSRAWPLGLALAASSRRRLRRHLPLRSTNYWTLSRLRSAAGRGLREGARDDRSGSTSRARRSAAAASRSTSTCRPATPPTRTRRYPVLYLLHGVPGRPGAFLATVRMGVVQDELVALHRARPMILVMPFGSTGSFTDEEWANGVGPATAGRRSSRAMSCARSTRRYRTIRRGSGRALAGLSEGGYGALNIGIHHPGEFRVARELVRLRARRRHRRRSSAIAPRCCAANSPQRPLAAAAAALRARAHVRSGSTAAPATASSRRTAASRSSSTRPPAPPPLLRRPRRAQLGALARQRGARLPRGLERPSWRVEQLGASRAAPASRSPRRAGSTSCSPRCPGRGSATSCRSTSSRGTRRRRSSGTSSSGARPAPRSASTPAGRGSSG